MDLHQRITDNNCKDRSALVYDFSTFSLKSSSTSEFKLWWETSLGCEHLISPGCAQPHTPTHAHTHTTHFIGGLWEAGLTGAWHKNYTSGSSKPANSLSVLHTHTQTHTHLWLLWDRTLTFCSSLQQRIIYYFWGSFIIGACNAALCKCDAVLFLLRLKELKQRCGSSQITWNGFICKWAFNYFNYFFS